MTELRFDANLKWLFTEVDFLERFDAAAAAGFTAVEFADPYGHPAADIARRLGDADLELLLINSPIGAADSPAWRGYACLPGAQSQFRESFELALDYAVRLGSEFIHVMAGAVPGDVAFERAREVYLSNLDWAAQTARPSGVRLVLEAQNAGDAPRYLLGTQAQARAAIDQLDAPNVGILLDLYHLHLTEGDLPTRLSEHLPDCFHVQVADPPGRHEPGTGEIDFRLAFDTIRASDYRGWIGCEYTPVGDTARGLHWIEELAR